ncbi:hypothetical protein [Flagellimonas sp. CMM7]|uniref:hypothetical protein n=1 Tax=Flagellimonas sp. CMM7 TaxID=2654676 RepID=UPI0013D69666|nr:hypothetical protein [Flagellimonas sp. CMM7]UII79369.1 hypothetical protein LV704_17120 [Flagellimonas sp. CMM7]
MKKLTITIILLALVSLGLKAQSTANVNLTNIPQESVYLHYNESFLFSGEHLLYKFYSLDNVNRKLSSISKMGYVALVDKEGNAVFKHKVRLTGGSGYGNFFVPTSVPTGSYRLLGYSEWMKNFGKEHFFQSDIYIVNPYQATPDSYLEQPIDSLQAVVSKKSTLMPLNTNVPEVNSSFVSLTIDKPTAGKREKMVLNVSGIDAAANNGSYAISVRKIDSFSAPAQLTSGTFYKELLKKGSTGVKTGIDAKIPELRGETITGVIRNKETKLPVKDKRISLSLPGDKYLLKVANSDDDGRFRFIVDREYDNATAAIQVLSDDWDLYEISMDEEKIDSEGMEFTDFVLTKEMKDYMLEKSIQNQIENAYQEVKADAITPASHVQPFYRKFTTVYDLDDYTRFNSIPETIVEVVDQVGIRKLDNGNRVFEVRPEIGYTDASLLPMVFVDGLFIKKHEDFMDYSAKKIKTISFSRDKVILGSQLFQGIISFKTIEGGFYDDFFTPHIVNVELFKPQSNKEYFSQEYSDEGKQDRVPDFRHQLLWVPKLDISNGKKEVTFYTSDVAGDYELVLEGFTSTGKPVSVKKKIVVR